MTSGVDFEGIGDRLSILVSGRKSCPQIGNPNLLEHNVLPWSSSSSMIIGRAGKQETNHTCLTHLHRNIQNETAICKFLHRYILDRGKKGGCEL